LNRIGRQTWWYGCDVDGTLLAYGYRSRIYVIDPARWPIYFLQTQRMAPAQMLPKCAPTRAASGS
jgi:hypothetical protein